MKINRCLFCKTDNIKVVNASFGSVPSYYCSCQKCHAKGPHGWTELEAVERWNIEPYQDNKCCCPSLVTTENCKYGQAWDKCDLKHNN